MIIWKEAKYKSQNTNRKIQIAKYKSQDVPKDYWPRTVYILNMMTGEYEHVGMYEKNNENQKYVFVNN